MKSKIYLGGLICTLVLTLGGCKAKQSAFDQVHARAQQRSTLSQTPGYDPSRVAEQQPTSVNDYFQEERLSTVDGRNLKQYSVVIGSFLNKTNAESLRNRMQAQGYSPFLAQNEKGMYRVIVATFDSRSEAAAQRNAIKSRYPEFYDAWLLNRLY